MVPIFPGGGCGAGPWWIRLDWSLVLIVSMHSKHVGHTFFLENGRLDFYRFGFNSNPNVCSENQVVQIIPGWVLGCPGSLLFPDKQIPGLCLRLGLLGRYISVWYASCTGWDSLIFSLAWFSEVSSAHKSKKVKGHLGALKILPRMDTFNSARGTLAGDLFCP